MWNVAGSARYYGNDTIGLDCRIYNSGGPFSEIKFDDAIITFHFDAVTFSNGNATISFNDGIIINNGK